MAARILAVFDISKCVRDDGTVIEPVVKFSSEGISRWVTYNWNIMMKGSVFNFTSIATQKSSNAVSSLVPRKLQD